MSCQSNPCNNTQTGGNACGNSGFVIIIVLYILLAIILGSCLF